MLSYIGQRRVPKDHPLRDSSDGRTALKELRPRLSALLQELKVALRVMLRNRLIGTYPCGSLTQHVSNAATLILPELRAFDGFQITSKVTSPHSA